MVKSTLLLTLLSLQGVFAGLGKEGRAVVASNMDSNSRNALPGYNVGRVQKRQDEGNNNDDDNGDAEKQFSLPEVQSMPGVSIENMDEIEAVDLPRLETVDGDLTIAGNENLETLALPALRRVGGNLVLDGAFTAVELPALAEVGGVVSIASSHNDFNCTAFEDDLADVDVGGDLLCQSPQNNDEEEDEDDNDDDNDGDNADDDNNDDDGDGDDTSGAAGAPRLGWLALLAVSALLML